ncbi:MAG: hypothetical protein MUC83_13890 [Pirellula sp.]|jgi:hypothetical protein|nr:hypothetical protein [Pirellula sp.]
MMVDPPHPFAKRGNEGELTEQQAKAQIVELVVEMDCLWLARIQVLSSIGIVAC